MNAKNIIPQFNLIRIAYTIFIAILVPIYWKKYGPENFLWFCDVTLFMVLLGLWLRSNLLISMASIWFLPFTFLWNICFFGRFIFGRSILGLSNYMFDHDIELYIQGLSLFHVWIPAILIWLLYKFGYNKKALGWVSFITWVLLPITYLVTSPDKNINWVFGLRGTVQTILPPLAYLVVLTFTIPMVVYYPMHRLLKKIFVKRQSMS
jgi:hypothetical protein